MPLPVFLLLLLLAPFAGVVRWLSLQRRLATATRAVGSTNGSPAMPGRVHDPPGHIASAR